MGSSFFQIGFAHCDFRCCVCSPSLPQEAASEARWCPDTWQWYSREELSRRFAERWSAKDIGDHWDWKMQHKDPIWETANSACSAESLKPLRFPHGLVYVTQDGISKPARY